MKKGTSFSGSLSIILLALVLAFSMPMDGYATELEKKASNLNSQLDDLETELSQTVSDIEKTAREIEEQKGNLSQAEANKQKQYEDMKLRIKYMYENGPYSMLQIIIESNSLASLESNIEYVRTISEYDNDMLEKYKQTYREVEEKDAALQGKRSDLADLQTSLEEKISNVQAALSDTNNAIAKEKQKALEEKLAKAKKMAEAASPSQPKKQDSPAEKPAQESKPKPEKPKPEKPKPEKPKPEKPKPEEPEEETPGSDATYTLSEFMYAGMINWNGYKFTYYSQSVLPGGSLNIPGRHVNADGYVSDGAGYICLAGSAPMGTVYNTPFGYKGKIYDRGTSGKHLDVYIR